MIDSHSIGRVLLDAGRVTAEDYANAVARSKETGKPPYEMLVLDGKTSVDELLQSVIILLDITLLKEALGMDGQVFARDNALRPLGSYLERISLLFKTGILLCSQKNIRSLVDLLIKEAPSVMNAERATIFLADHRRKELFSHLGVGLEYGQIRIPWDSGIAGSVFTTGKSLNIADPYKDPRFNQNVDHQTGFRTKSLLCVPLRTPGGEVIGVFQVLNKRAGVFTGTDMDILEILSSQAARSIDNMLEWNHDSIRNNLVRQEEESLREVLRKSDPLKEIVGDSLSMQEVRALIRKVAPTETTVLIQGESGTGKELVARALHRLSHRSEGPLIVLNCAAIPAELIESELFGYKKGAFTGATTDREGVFKSAHQGTLFLDEIEATSPAMQVKLLRAIQSGEVKRVGDNRVELADVRLIAATNQDLRSLVAEGDFREDLFYRVNVFPVTLPPLRERIEDVPSLVELFLAKFSQQTGKHVSRIDPAALELLCRYQWPGNIRELENEIERLHILTPEQGAISVGGLSSRIGESVGLAIDKGDGGLAATLKETVDSVERKMVMEALESYGGNRSLAAKRLGLSRQGLLNKIKKFAL